MDRLLVGQVAALGDLDRVDLADQIGHRDVGRGELLAVALRRGRSRRSASASPSAGDAAAARARRSARAGSSLIGQPATTGTARVEERRQAADDARLFAWPRSPRNTMWCPARIAFSISGMTRLVVADDAGQDALAARERARAGSPHLLAHRAHGVCRTPSARRACSADGAHARCASLVAARGLYAGRFAARSNQSPGADVVTPQPSSQANAAAQAVVGGEQVLGHDPHVGRASGMKFVSPRPARHDVPVEMVRDAGAGARARGSCRG